jgi:membrane associated rhomboid family serine protease
MNVAHVPASIVLGFWIVLQLLSGISTVGHSQGGVAFFAHIGGFIMGILMLKLFESRRRYYGRWSHFAG